MHHARRRRLLAVSLLMPWVTHAQQRRPVDAPLQVGFESCLAACGLPDAVRRGFATATGLSLSPVLGPSSTLLNTLDAGELDAAITQAPEVEERMLAQGLSHDRQLVARSRLLLVGPDERGRRTVDTDAAVLMRRLASEGRSFLSLGDGGGAHLAEAPLWAAAGVVPDPAWYRRKPSQPNAWLATIAAAGAHALVDRSLWLSGPTRGLRVWCDADPRLASAFHVQRPFRSKHTAGKLFVAWLAGAGGRGVVSRVGKGLARG